MAWVAIAVLFFGTIGKKIAVRFTKKWNAWGKRPYTWMDITDVEEVKEARV
jgi:hypothetical protein